MCCTASRSSCLAFRIADGLKLSLTGERYMVAAHSFASDGSETLLVTCYG